MDLVVAGSSPVTHPFDKPRPADVPLRVHERAEVGQVFRQRPLGMIVEPSAATLGQEAPGDVDDIFAEMEPYVAEGSTAVDDSREAMYTRWAGE